MTASSKIGLLAVMIVVIAVIAGVVANYRRLARRDEISMWGAVRRYHRPDLDLFPLAWWRVNLVYRSRMRSTGKKGPSGEVMPVDTITVEIPEEDYQFIQQVGTDEFMRQLQGYRHQYAVEHHWLANDDPAAKVLARRSRGRRRLRPKVHFGFASDGLTSVLTGRGQEERTEQLGAEKTQRERGERLSGDVTHPLGDPARLSWEGQEWLLYPAESPYRLGRADVNEIRIAHPEVSAHQAVLRHSGVSWVLEPLRTTNATKVAGKPVLQAARLDSGASITIGAFGPLVFEDRGAGGRR